MLEQACAIADMDAEGTGTWTEAVSPANQRLTGATKKILPVTRESLSATDGAREGPPVVDEIPSVLAQSLGGMDDFENENDWGNTPIDTDAALKDDDDQPLSDGATPHTDADADMNGMSPKMKQRVRSTTLILRKSQSRSLMARQILHKRAPTVFSSSGANLVERAAAATDAAAREQHGSKAAPMRVKSFPAFKYVPWTWRGRGGDVLRPLLRHLTLPPPSNICTPHPLINSNRLQLFSPHPPVHITPRCRLQTDAPRVKEQSAVVRQRAR